MVRKSFAVIIFRQITLVIIDLFIATKIPIRAKDDVMTFVFAFSDLNDEIFY